jgi:hypothetical protein
MGGLGLKLLGELKGDDHSESTGNPSDSATADGSGILNLMKRLALYCLTCSTFSLTFWPPLLLFQ